MNYASVLKKIEKLGDTEGSTAKKGLLRGYLDDKHFVKVIQYALDADKQYYASNTLNKPGAYNSETLIDEQTVFGFLDQLNKQRSATNKDKDVLRDMAAADHALSALLKLIVKKDIRCGVGAKIINAVKPHTIFDIPYQQCSKIDKLNNVNMPAIVQKKADGMFSYFIPGGHPRNGLPFMTRNGSGFHLFDTVELEAMAVQKAIALRIHSTQITVPTITDLRSVLIGEMLVFNEDFTYILDRKTSNGLMDKFIEGTGDSDLATRVRYVTWGALPIAHFYAEKSIISYAVLFNILAHTIQKLKPSVIQLIESEIVTNIAAASKFYTRMRNKGFEGAILKDFESKWAYNRSPKQVKMKNVSENEFRIVDAYYGKPGKKYEDILGGLIIRTEDSKVVTRVGMGFSDCERALGVGWWRNRIGGVVTCKFTDVIDDKTDRITKCLENARFVETRFNEKIIADNLEDLT